MIYSQDQELIQRKSALVTKLMNDNHSFLVKWSTLYTLSDDMMDYLDEELFNLGFHANENSARIEAVLEHLKVLTDRFFNDISLCIDNFRSDTDWLTKNICKCDPFHTHIWWETINQANDYPQLFNTLFTRFLKVCQMIDVVSVLLNSLSHA
ncbi:hypothetical protein AVEN_110843-1 [Araneus ventricosus]|uniref:Uncharacterized protein n=1 Tax=Araneus ventricosus TaxID=182803 RepID=A0A4Y2N924_ARAVE|nr:hypothetical protein AVEN_110843-1 [Araneus ventricosus]